MSHPLKITTRIPLPPPTPPSTLLSALHAYTPLITANPYLKSYISLPLPCGSSSSSSPSPSPSDYPHPIPPSLTDDPQFFQPSGPDGYNPASYLITDSVPLLPLPDWLGGGSLLGSKEVSVPCTFQSFGYGVRCKAVAAAGAGAVVVRSSYEVRHRYRPKHSPQTQAAQAEAQSSGGQQPGKEGQQDREEVGLGLGQGLRAGLRKGGPDDLANNPNPNSKSKPPGTKLINKATGTSIENYEYELVEIATIECPAIVRPFVKAKFEKGHQEVLQRVVDQVVADWMEELRSSKGSGAASGTGRGRTLLQEIQQS
ncbi:hypothetical protein B0H65DRAFT_580013 [Neurospora tetraspora]|uniref:DUF7053 domain-containing protein n=1 Tax=Neurospora tetraspora TaxID=94610 RepID=A0AAE0J9A7_9PEZI|nr:hypothetical protein B0H65DRAFT_580013 [Neurospora tetraspora]